MVMRNSYIINPLTVLIAGEYNQFGKLCTRVLEQEKSFLVSEAPKEVLDNSMKYIGYDLKGALSSAKEILGPGHMLPIMVNLHLGLCMFPIKSPQKDDCIWFSLTHVKKPEANGRKTKVNLSFGLSIIVDSRLSAFKTKIQTASDLSRITYERSKSPITFFLEPKNKRELFKQTSGFYNFKDLEYEEE